MPKLLLLEVSIVLISAIYNPASDRMPWKCPACSTPIRRELTEAGHDEPQPERIYRCSVCHLELVVNDEATQMILAPLAPPPTERHK